VAPCQLPVPTVHQHAVLLHAPLHLQLPAMQIFIRMPTGELLVLAANPSDTIAAIKCEIDYRVSRCADAPDGWSEETTAGERRHPGGVWFYEGVDGARVGVPQR
jgi:hypothetical protein